MEERTPLLEVKDLKQHFKVNKKYSVKAVDGISFVIYPGETYGLVGESGSGKSTTGRSIIRLYEPTSGTITFEGVDISGKLSQHQVKHLRTKMQMIFQDPMACLNPRKKVIDIIAEGLDIHHLCKDSLKFSFCLFLCPCRKIFHLFKYRILDFVYLKKLQQEIGRASCRERV